MAAPLVFSVFKKDNEAIFDTGETAPIVRYESILLDNGFQAQLIDHISRISQFSSSFQPISHLSNPATTGPLRTEDSEQLIRLGRILFNHLMPGNIRKILTDASPGDLILRLDDQLLAIPWELAHDGTDFIGTKFRIGRQILRSGAFENDPSRLTPVPHDRVKLLLILDPTGTLPEVNAEAEVMLELLDRQNRVSVEVIGGDRATKFHILRALEDFHVVHFAGHSISQEQGIQKIGWRLRDGILAPEEIGRLNRPPYLIFSNSCMAAASQSPEVRVAHTRNPNPGKHDSSPAENLGLGGNFLLAGVSQFIGALWVIHDQSSAEFAGAFYEKLLSGESIGQSLLCAKRRAIEQRSAQTYIWAAYVHYGDPGQALISNEAAVVKTQPRPFVETGPAAPKTRRRAVWYLSLALGITICLVSLAGYHFLKKTADQAVPLYNRGNVAEGIYAQAVADYEAGKINHALGALKHLTNRADNSDGLGLALLSEIYAEAGLEEEAEAALEAAIKRNPYGAPVQWLLGERYWRCGDSQKAEQAFTNALEDPDPWMNDQGRTYLGLGALSFYQGNLEQAKKEFQTALDYQTAHADARTNLGVIHLIENEPQKALSDFNIALQSGDKDEMALGFVQLLEKPLAPANDQGAGEGLCIAVGPFIFTGGTLRRIGLDVLITENLLRQRVETPFDRFCAVSPVYGPKYQEYGLQTLSRLLNLTTHVNKTGCRLGLFGEFEMSRHVIYLHLKLVDLHTGEIHLDKKIREEGNKKVKNVILSIESEARDSLNQLANEFNGSR